QKEMTYTLTETKAPEGHELSKKTTWEIKIASDGTVTIDGKTVRFSLFARIGKRSSGLRKCSFFFYYQTVITRRTRMKPKKRKLLDLLMLFLLLSGIGILAYPFVSDALNNYLDQQII
ncbi:prealbumin-like fold domain-containing protein, partial [Enterococcus faecium]|nr:prealbumin-like fold domain-containing protein [Enterococcus faecium]